MLSRLNIQNFLLIPTLSIEFHSGLNLLTGETGSGKSIIVDALKLLLGTRTDIDTIRDGAQSAIVEGTFEVVRRTQPRVEALLEEIGVNYAASGSLNVRREVRSSGRHRIFINDTNVTAATLKRLQPCLLDIHGQFEHQSLLSTVDQLDLLDVYANCWPLRDEAEAAYKALNQINEEKRELARAFSEREQMIDMLRFQLSEIDRINPTPGEDAELLRERALLASVEKRRQLSVQAYDVLYESDQSVISNLAGVLRRVEDLRDLDAQMTFVAESIEQAAVLLRDAAETILDYSERAEYSPERLAIIEERLSQLERLKRKYQANLNELIALREHQSAKLQSLHDLSGREALLARKFSQAMGAYREAATRLSTARQQAIPKLERQVKQELEKVSLENATFVVKIQSIAPGEIADDAGKWSSALARGLDSIEFLLSANRGESLKPLARVASGGELSRMMLTLRLVIKDSASNPSSPAEETLIFDEIDAGVGGRAAESVGRRLKSLAERQQVICVTHQPQIARFADHHFYVSKSIEKQRTVTSARELTYDERVGELARMIGGAEDAASTRAAARWLLEGEDEKRAPTRVASRKTRAKRV